MGVKFKTVIIKTTIPNRRRRINPISPEKFIIKFLNSKPKTPA